MLFPVAQGTAHVLPPGDPIHFGFLRNSSIRQAIGAKLFRFVSLDGAADSCGVVVVVDVLRAFTVAAVGLARGATSVRCVATVEEAVAARREFPRSLLMGEVDGRPVPTFDLANSPSHMLRAAVSGRTLIHRSTAGTQGVVRAAPKASALYAASFLSARATALKVATHDSKEVTFIVTGAGDDSGDEDQACAEYIAALLNGDRPDPIPYLDRVLHSRAAQKFLGCSDPDFPAGDVGLAMALDVVDFALAIEVEDGVPVIRAME